MPQHCSTLLRCGMDQAPVAGWPAAKNTTSICCPVTHVSLSCGDAARTAPTIKEQILRTQHANPGNTTAGDVTITEDELDAAKKQKVDTARVTSGVPSRLSSSRSMEESEPHVNEEQGSGPGLREKARQLELGETEITLDHVCAGTLDPTPTVSPVEQENSTAGVSGMATVTDESRARVYVPGVEGPSSTTMLQLAEAALEELYEIHDTFFSSEQDEKQRRLKAKAQEVMEAVSRVGDPRDVQQRARLSYIRGRALDVFSDFDKEAEACLARAVKLRLSDADGWSALGHCYWKKSDLFAAKRCYLQALHVDRKADSLRQLSMLLRQLPGTPMETAGHLQDSLKLAKEAITLDAGCGESWYVMGNAYVASFFRNSRGLKDLDRALQAYSKAESNGARSNPDLYFNRAQVLQYREDYPAAARNYRAAKRLDPLLPVEKALAAIETGVDRLAKLVEKKGGLKAKRMSQLIAPLKALPAGEGLGAASSLRYLGDLRLGVNKGVAVALKLVMSAGPCNPPPERLVVVDAQGDCAVLSLYSITKDACEKIASKDILVVKEPALRTISLSDGGDKSRSCPASYPCIQADPAEMLINGQSMLGSFAAPVVRLVNFDK